MPEAANDFAPRLQEVQRFSRFLQRQLQSRPWLEERLANSVHRPLDGNGMRAWIAEQAPNDDSVADHLRRLRAWTLCHLAYRDLAGLADLAEVTETMSALADVAVATAHDILQATLTAKHGIPRNADGVEQHLMVIGMGKLGGRELNVSSDVDFIFVFPDDGETDGARPISNFEFFTRLGQRLNRSQSGNVSWRAIPSAISASTPKPPGTSSTSAVGTSARATSTCSPSTRLSVRTSPARGPAKQTSAPGKRLSTS